MINPSAQARAILTTKSVNIETARGMGCGNRGTYHSYEHRQRMSDSLRVILALDKEARRYYRAERRSRWLTNCIVERGDRKTFDLEGIDPLTGRRYAVHLEMPLDATLLDFLLMVMRYEGAPTIMRLDCAKNAASLMHKKPRRQVVVIDERRSSHVASAKEDPRLPPDGDG